MVPRTRDQHGMTADLHPSQFTTNNQSILCTAYYAGMYGGSFRSRPHPKRPFSHTSHYNSYNSVVTIVTIPLAERGDPRRQLKPHLKPHYQCYPREVLAF